MASALKGGIGSEELAEVLSSRLGYGATVGACTKISFRRIVHQKGIMEQVLGMVTDELGAFVRQMAATFLEE